MISPTSSRDFLRRIAIIGILFAVLLIIGTVGYRVLEGWPWIDALYMTIITLSTVGFGEIRPLSEAGRLFTTGLIVAGVGSVAYMFSTVAEYIVAGELHGILRRQRMENKIRNLSGHYIVCGYGRVGSHVTQELQQNHVDVVIIDSDPQRMQELENSNLYAVFGDASEDSVLLQAGIERAAGLAACLPQDADNVFVTLTARTLNPNLTVIARVNALENERKLRIAGAAHVINPYSISGHRMARQLIHPNVVEFMDVVMRRGEVELRMEEIQVSETSGLQAKTIAECDIRRRTGANVLAVRRPAGRTFTTFGSDFVIQAGDTLIALGTPEQLDALAALADDRRRQHLTPARISRPASP